MSALTYTRLTGRVIVANLVVQIVIIATGGAVRLTGSGLGCSSWPNCAPGQFTPTLHGETSFHPYVEWGNRMMGAVVVVVALAVALLVFFAHRRGVRPVPSTRLLWLATVPLLLSLVQAVLGGLTVVMELHPALVGSHFLFSAVLVWLSTWLVIDWYQPGRARPAVPARLRTVGWLLAAVSGVVVVLGMVVTGSGPHSGDDEVGYRFAVDPVLVAKSHAGAVWVFVALLVALLVLAHRARPRQGSFDDGAGQAGVVRHRALVLLGLTLAQGAIGYVQYFTGLPELLVGFHMVGAALLLVATAWTVAGMSERASRAELAVGGPAQPVAAAH